MKHDEEEWRGFQDGPWPRVLVEGDLERAESEWLASNNLGAYSMSTVALMHTRRQHGLLVSHLAEDFRRHVVLSHLEMSLEVSGRNYSLSTHQFPNMAPTLGYRHLESFTQDPLPRWVYRFPSGTIERTISLVHDRQAVVVALTWSGKEKARLSLRPLMPMRPSEDLCHEHGGMLQKVTLRSGVVEVQPVTQLPSVHFQHTGVFMGFPDWWRKFEYLDDRARYDDFQEDMWSPGVFEFEMKPRETRYLVVSVGAPLELPPEELVMEAAQLRLQSDPAHLNAGIKTGGRELLPEVRGLSVAAESFVFADGAAVIAGYPWLDVWSRDTLLSIPGLFLCRGQGERGERALRHLLRNEEDGFLVDRTTASEDEQRPCVDASLWLAEIGLAVVRESGDEELGDELFAALVRIFERVTQGPKLTAWLTAEGLLANGLTEKGEDYPLTWMESIYAGKAFTPRRGLAVEFQALWYRFCTHLAAEAERRSESEVAQNAREAADRLKDAFLETFWCHETKYPFDGMSEAGDSADAWADPSVRPNALIALAVAPELFEPWQSSEVLARVEERLLTPVGLRTLEESSPNYIGHSGDTVEERMTASHQGAVWPHLLLYYARAKLREQPDSAEQLRDLVRASLNDPRALGNVGQTADGDSPHRFWGIPAYASATAMLLEALTVDLAEEEACMG